MKAQPKYKYRLTFSKKRRVKYVGHLDMVTTWTRAFRRAGLPIAYSKGFNPHARIQVAASLPLGYISQAELMDVFLTQPVGPNEIMAKVGGSLPVGFSLLSVEEVDPKGPPLQKILTQAKYQITVETEVSSQTLKERIDQLMAADKVMQTRIRRKREEAFDLRPMIHDLKLDGIVDRDKILKMRLSTGQNGNLRPDAVLEALQLQDAWSEIERTQLIFDNF